MKNLFNKKLIKDKDVELDKSKIFEYSNPDNDKKSNSNKVGFFSLPSTQISIIYYIISTVILIGVSVCMPLILNYPPNSLNNAFDIKMSGISYIAQFVCVDLIALLAIYLLVRKLFTPIDDWYKHKDEPKYKKTAVINNIRKKCFNLPYMAFLLELIVPGIIAVIVLSLTGSHESTMILKLSVLVTAFSFIFSVTSYIFSKNLFSKILSETYTDNSDIGIRINLGKKILLQVLPLFMTGMLIISLVGYSKSIKTASDTLFNVYSTELENVFAQNKNITFSGIQKLLSKVQIYGDENDTSVFILDEDKNITMISGREPSEFFVEYTLDVSDLNDGRSYDSYAVDTQRGCEKDYDRIWNLLCLYNV